MTEMRFVEPKTEEQQARGGYCSEFENALSTSELNW